MAQLIQMRQRIKAVETIKKITHAMRLISMSTHTRLRSKQEPLKAYQNAVSQLFYRTRAATPSWHNAILYPDKKRPSRSLVILVGSQKGLCGNFNSALFKLFEHALMPEELAQREVIAVGKKTADYIKHKKIKHLLAAYPEFAATLLPHITQQIVNHILDAQPYFTSVTVYSNILKTFFVQKPHVTGLIPFGKKELTEESTSQPTTDFVWEHDPLQVLDMLALQTLEITIRQLLFESLLAEQAARFISMDSSTRNAEKILEETILWYNKLRQAKITKELTELTGSF